MEYTVFNEEVLYTTKAVTSVAGTDVEFLKTMAIKNSRGRIRLCAHPNIQDALHEMIIVLSQGFYVRPHKHMGKSESFHIIEGSLKVIIFDEDGSIQSVFKMGHTGSGETLFCRMSDNTYHTVVPQSQVVVFHEVTNGPFRREDTLYAPWAPDEQDREEAMTFTETLSRQIVRSG